jgi:hypothetical protein
MPAWTLAKRRATVAFCARIACVSDMVQTPSAQENLLIDSSRFPQQGMRLKTWLNRAHYLLDCGYVLEGTIH